MDFERTLRPHPNIGWILLAHNVAIQMVSQGGFERVLFWEVESMVIDKDFRKPSINQRELRHLPNPLCSSARESLVS